MRFMRQSRLILSLLLLHLAVNCAAQTGSFNLEDWPQTQAALKPMYVKAIMEQAGVHSVSFTRTAEFYAAELDRFAEFARANSYLPYLKTSVAQNLATIAVVNCDWNNGIPHWEFAQNYLGEKQLALLQPVYGDAINKLKNNCAATSTAAQ
ncbi:hypothetical protein [Cellvibrio sp. OA-2007]|uniref:hypothetical protein n=1 Tax=Cellvibrio sp. OA-2007 TaxID=529823 RepID=UPI000782F8D3|nr:hypothetical protein [Cellvibrio sp. OA-2007]